MIPTALHKFSISGIVSDQKRPTKFVTMLRFHSDKLASNSPTVSERLEFFYELL